jgi:hypothetical protein
MTWRSNKISTKIAYTPYVHVSKNLEGECGGKGTFVEWKIHNNLLPQKDVNHPFIKNHFGHTW